jgi:hypothetical protein
MLQHVLLSLPAFLRNQLPLSSWWKSKFSVEVNDMVVGRGDGSEGQYDQMEAMRTI